MNTDLVHPSGFGKTTDQRKPIAVPFKTVLHLKAREAGAARGITDLAHPDRRRTEISRPDDCLGAAP